MNDADGQLIGTLIGLGIAVVVMALRWRRLNRARKLRLEWLWVTPAILIVTAALVMIGMPPRLSDTPWLALAFALGAAAGWYRGKLMTISVDPATHTLSQRASPWAMLSLVALAVVRMGARGLLTDSVGLVLTTDALLVFVVGMFGVMRVEMFIRGRRMLHEARAAA